MSLREARGWKPYRLAKDAGIAFSTLRLIEKGEGEPSLGVLLALTSALGLVSIEELIGSGELGTPLLRRIEDEETDAIVRPRSALEVR